jgi:hypothetical protein
MGLGSPELLPQAQRRLPVEGVGHGGEHTLPQLTLHIAAHQLLNIISSKYKKLKRRSRGERKTTRRRHRMRPAKLVL